VPGRGKCFRNNRHGVTNERVVKKGIANHLESESCEGDRKVTLEALTGAYAGRESSSEIGNSESRLTSAGGIDFLHFGQTALSDPLHFVEIDLPPAWHRLGILVQCHRAIAKQEKRSYK
jgi:hypothetical protein